VEADNRRLWRIITAGVLAIFTLLVFSRLQEYGPESAIRRFHVDAVARDYVDLQKVTTRSIDTVSAVQLAGIAKAFLTGGARYQLLRMERTPIQVRAAVVYTDAAGQTFPMIWVVEKIGRSWRVNADQTMRIYRDSREPLASG